MPAQNWMSQFLLRKLHSNAIFVSLYWTRGKNINQRFFFKQKLKTTTTTQISTTTTQITPIEPVFWFKNFFIKILFRAMCLFSSLRDLSTKVICKAATDLRKFQRQLTRRTINMLIMRHTRLWTENCTFLEGTMMAQRYFSFCLRIRKITKLLIEILNRKSLKI